MRIDVFTIFPGADGAVARRQPDRQGPGRGGCWTCGSTTCAPWPPIPIARSTTRTFGGGPGMVLAPEPVFKAVEAAQPPRPLYLLSPAGRRFDQALAAELAQSEGFSLLCGRYEGVDQRIADHLVDGELSVGDFVLAGGEVAALAVVEAVARLVPGVMGNAGSADEETFADGLLEYPHYTRPADFRGWVVPEVLRSGDHGQVARWRRAQALARTRRPPSRSAGGTRWSGAAELALLAEFGLDGDVPGSQVVESPPNPLS